ncbi:Hypothetical_protein [Hexamita inflata]|uniref:Hypothetical_protein n=1 Tax=Hexamita inflata TaxID=28002 RepID=A0AA86NF44_9EUKA|nr:Hypothetical protein HINF_LOCUS5644 [Hexamita inflata]
MISKVSNLFILLEGFLLCEKISQVIRKNTNSINQTNEATNDRINKLEHQLKNGSLNLDELVQPLQNSSQYYQPIRQQRSFVLQNDAMVQLEQQNNNLRSQLAQKTADQNAEAAVQASMVKQKQLEKQILEQQQEYTAQINDLQHNIKQLNKQLNISQLQTNPDQQIALQASMQKQQQLELQIISQQQQYQQQLNQQQQTINSLTKDLQMS